MGTTISKMMTVTLKSKKTVTTEVIVTGGYEANHGADADGNRGIGVWFLDDYEFIPQNTDDKEEPLSKEEQAEFESLIESEIENAEWDFDQVVHDKRCRYLESLNNGE